MLEPQDAAAPRSNTSAGKVPVACQHLAHMGWSGRQLNQQRGISWLARGMSETLTAWSSLQITLEHSSTSILLTIGSTFTLLCWCVCTFTPGAGLWSSDFTCRCSRPSLRANKGWCLMRTHWGVVLPKCVTGYLLISLVFLDTYNYAFVSKLLLLVRLL